MPRRSFEDVRREEREAIAAFAEARGQAAEALASEGKIDPDEARWLRARLRAFAGDVRAGLHHEEERADGR